MQEGKMQPRRAMGHVKKLKWRISRLLVFHLEITPVQRWVRGITAAEPGIMHTL